MSEVLTEFVAVDTRSVPPDPGVLKAIGLNHAFESAIADLVDNSVDAHASQILVRFVLRRGLITHLLVVDNGRGMTADEVDGAMRLGRPNPHSTDALGHFGMGLKAASFSQADELTVLTRHASAHGAGRRMFRDRARGKL